VGLAKFDGKFIVLCTGQKTLLSSATQRKRASAVITSFKVTGHRFWRQSKNHMDFLLVININLHPISHRFQVIADYWAKFMLSTGGGYFSLTHSFGVNPLNSRSRNLASRYQKDHSIVRCKMRFDIFIIVYLFRNKDRHTAQCKTKDMNSEQDIPSSDKLLRWSLKHTKYTYQMCKI